MEVLQAPLVVLHNFSKCILKHSLILLLEGCRVRMFSLQEEFTLLMLLFIQTLHGLIGAILLILSRIHQEAGGNLPMRLITVSFHRTQYQFGTTQYSL